MSDFIFSTHLAAGTSMQLKMYSLSGLTRWKVSAEWT